MDARTVLEQLEQLGGDLAPSLAYVAVQAVAIDEGELAGARRRALLVLASGGDPNRELDPDGRAVSVLAEDLDTPERRDALRGSLTGLLAEADGLPGVRDVVERLLVDSDRAWRWAACALLAADLG